MQKADAYKWNTISMHGARCAFKSSQKLPKSQKPGPDNISQYTEKYFYTQGKNSAKDEAAPTLDTNRLISVLF